MTYWTIRAGRNGERVEWALANSVVGGGWQDFGDLTPYKADREQLRALVAVTVGGSANRIATYTGQIWSMISRIHEGDRMVLSNRETGQLAIGEVTRAYYFQPDETDPAKKHRLDVRWIRTDIPFSNIKQDLLYQMRSALTVFQIGNNDAAYRLDRVLEGQNDPGARTALDQVVSGKDESGLRDELVSQEFDALNLEEIAQDTISTRLQEEFKGHDLSELVTAILTLEGYKCRNSPPGADGGVDILAGKGPLGMDSPKLVVQVKSQSSAVSDVVLQQLNGAIHRYSADQALLVTFGGVTSPAKAYLESQYFKIRVWAIRDILDATIRHYENLPNELKARLPLKQTWIPVLEDGS